VSGLSVPITDDKDWYAQKRLRGPDGHSILGRVKFCPPVFWLKSDGLSISRR
jgi:hypothetical protein